MLFKKIVAFAVSLAILVLGCFVPTFAVELPEHVFPSPEFNYGGASVLKPEISQQYDTQAIRVYYEYSVSGNGKVLVGNSELAIKERGVLIKAAGKNNTELTVSNIGKDGIIVANKKQNFNECWKLDSANGKLTYSVYVANLNQNDTREISFRGYIILEDNVVYYTETVTFSANDITNKDIANIFRN